MTDHTPMALEEYIAIGLIVCYIFGTLVGAIAGAIVGYCNDIKRGGDDD